MEGEGGGRAAAVLVGLLELLVLAAVEVGCLGCGVIAEGNGRRPVTVRDLPVAGRRTVLIWLKRLGRCRASAWAVRS